MKCTLCEKPIGDIDAAINAGWIPSFWVNSDEYFVCCPDCTEKYLQVGSDDEMEMKPGLISTFLASASSRLDEALKRIELYKKGIL